MKLASPGRDEGPPARKRFRRGKGDSSTSDGIKPCIIQRLPFELLAEIFLYTESSKDLLSLARSSKFICATLLNPSSSFIWKTVRKTSLVPPPEPISTFTEASYAAFLYDGGPCEVCNKFTDALYLSFGLRLRLCKNYECRTRCIERKDLTVSSRSTACDKEIRKCLPSFEEGEHLLLHSRGENVLGFHRSVDWHHEVSNYNASPGDYVTKNNFKAAYITEYMKLCASLSEWKDLYQASFSSNRLANDTFSHTIASEKGWNHWDMLNCTPYGVLHRLKNKRIENVSRADFELISVDVDRVLVEMAEKRERRSHEAAYQKHLKDVSSHHNRLRSQQRTLPPLRAFRQLPIISVLQASPSTAKPLPSVARTLKTTSWVTSRLDADLKAWTESARMDLGAALGYPNWKTASTNVLHPVDRVTARFRCKNCTKLPVRYVQDGCFDFAGACAHDCAVTKKQRRNTDAWDSNKFVKDEKAITALTKLLSLCGMDASNVDSATTILDLGVTISCTSCKSGVLMDSKSLIGHSHRHDDMQITLVSASKAKTLLKHPFCHSIVQKLMGPERCMEEIRAKLNYGCRHCAFFSDQITPTEQSPQDATEKTRQRRPKKSVFIKPFSFNGLRSHLKEKHQFNDIRDEDMFMFERMVLPKT